MLVVSNIFNWHKDQRFCFLVRRLSICPWLADNGKDVLFLLLSSFIFRVCLLWFFIYSPIYMSSRLVNYSNVRDIKWAPSSEFVSSSIPSWQILTAHAQPFRGARDLAFCLNVPLDSLLVWASSGGSGETARMRRLAWTFAARIGDKYQIRLTRPKYKKLLCCTLN